MGSWRLEAGRFLLLVGFPIGSFWAFNQSGFYNYFVQRFKLPDSSENNEAVRIWKEGLMEERRKKDYEKFLLEQMAFEEARRLREQNKI